ncbi:MAG: ABC transporter permease [Leptospiraceae bacterium]|nr:ABC transporter permease [Leptospiraceae bacterium]
MLQPEWKYIYARELRTYFNTPIGYVFAVITLFFNFLLFFTGFGGPVPAFFDRMEPSIQNYMTLLPATFVLLVPAVTMRIWSEEKKSGTFELLASLPLRELDLVVAKFAAAWSYVAMIVLASLPLCLNIAFASTNFDWGSTFTMYAGSLLMAGAYVSTGMVISSLTREQIVAFILIAFVSFFMFITNYLFFFLQDAPDSVKAVLGFFSHGYHFSSFQRGLFYLPDIVYYISFIALMIAINVWILRRER